MAYTDDSVRAKLASLNETQDSVVSVAQWIMFHRRHADRTANLWLARLQEVPSTSKRLNLIYLANEVVQQSRARSKQDFLLAFEPIISEATALAYKNADANVRGKLRRVVEVWRERRIFDGTIQSGVEAKLDELDRDAGGTGKAGANGPAKAKAGKLGGGLFGSGSGSVPSELDGVSKVMNSLIEGQESVREKVTKAGEEFGKMTDPNTPVPTPPVHAARLSALGKTLATAQGAVEASLKARSDLVSQLEKLLQNNRERLEEDRVTFNDLKSKREGVEAKKNEVEDGIMRGLSAPSSPDIPTPTTNSPFTGKPNGTPDASAGEGRHELEQPETEDFTPPPEDRDIIEGDMPDETSMDDSTAHRARNSFTSTTGAESIQEQPPNFNELPPSRELPPAMSPTGMSPPAGMSVDPSNAAAAAEQFLSNLSATSSNSGIGQTRQASAELSNGASSDPRLKRRKLSHQSSSRTLQGDEMEVGMGFDAGVDEEGIDALLK